MASSDGQFYDVDFFLSGDPGAMTVTETTVHKLNGVPYYLWAQNADKVWVRAPVEDASNALLGVVGGTDAFEFRYQATLPEIKGSGRCWLPLAESDAFQTVTVRSIETPGKRQTLTDSAHGNRVLYLELTSQGQRQAHRDRLRCGAQGEERLRRRPGAGQARSAARADGPLGRLHRRRAARRRSRAARAT